MKNSYKSFRTPQNFSPIQSLSSSKLWEFCIKKKYEPPMSSFFQRPLFVLLTPSFFQKFSPLIVTFLSLQDSWYKSTVEKEQRCLTSEGGDPFKKVF